MVYISLFYRLYELWKKFKYILERLFIQQHFWLVWADVLPLIWVASLLSSSSGLNYAQNSGLQLDFKMPVSEIQPSSHSNQSRIKHMKEEKMNVLSNTVSVGQSNWPDGNLKVHFWLLFVEVAQPKMSQFTSLPYITLTISLIWIFFVKLL